MSYRGVFDIAAGVAGAYLGFELGRGFNLPWQATLATTAAGTAFGSTLANHYYGELIDSHEKTVKWIANDPLTALGVFGAFSGVINLLEWVFVPEAMALPVVRQLLTVGSLGLAAFFTWEVGPAVGNTIQVFGWMLINPIDPNWPEPIVIKQSGGIKDIPHIVWDNFLDLGRRAFWQDDLQPLIDDFKSYMHNHSTVDLMSGLARIVFFIPVLWGGLLQVYFNGQLKIVAAIAHSINH